MRLAEWDGGPEHPEGWSGAVPVTDDDLDADGDGSADTVVVARADGGAWVFTDVDADGFADRVLDVGGHQPDDDEPVLAAFVRLLTGR